ncbi:nitrate reductase [Obba rivulosa]|uniref:Nitrate reductase [NADPH] n=1 Tax=Obba rivulosa TaxID=1052685 RepID=A0A8E2ARW0_9APHY|nr:nitrate reductase [Obba rivulosa]
MASMVSVSQGEAICTPGRRSFTLPHPVPLNRFQPPPLPSIFPTIPVNEDPRETAEADLQTPDSWIKRNPDLVRLTGKHPFNTEARLRPLFDAGFLTPSCLHYVRNHGAVPKVDEARLWNWRIRVHGLVEHECDLSLQDLRDYFEVVTLPVTLVCAGNRRKEQNVVRKSLGFNWGAAGVSTALWTGVYLADVLKYVKPIRGKAKHVIFEGCDELPKGPYGTSQRLSWATSKEKGMLIAWAMNGQPLEPDHGFPVRIIVPGQIGGRSVKVILLSAVDCRELTHAATTLHFWDNKLLPSHVSPEQARSEEHWWYDPNELNTNSAIAKPDHDERLTIYSSDVEKMYNLRGYAYGGGGRRVTVVQVSLDDGRTWRLANIDYPEDKYRDMAHFDETYGKLDLTDSDMCFCWCFWDLDVKVLELASANSITLRAMDEGLHLQPRDMYLNATSMMNNWWFRVAIMKTENGIRFEHPTLAGAVSGGWMERLKSTGQDILNPVFGTASPTSPPAEQIQPNEVSMTNSSVTRRITDAEFQVEAHERPLFVIKGEVYDGGAYLEDHPGGADAILLAVGGDATDDFLTIHSVDAKIKLREYHIGTLDGPLDHRNKGVKEGRSDVFLRPKAWKPVQLTEFMRVNHDSYLYRFSFPGQSNQSLGLSVGQHVFVRLKRKDTGELVQRAYTPVSRENTVGGIEFLIKLYLPCSDFPVGGKMSTGLNQLRIGDTVELKGPLGSFIWKGCGTAFWKGLSRRVREVGMVCGGSGITPILQVLRSILHDTHDAETRTWLIYANKTEADILCRDELHELQALHGARFRIHHTLSHAPPGWRYSFGRIDDLMLSLHLPEPSSEGMILACAPSAMITDALRPGLQRLGWDVERSLVVF